MKNFILTVFIVLIATVLSLFMMNWRVITCGEKYIVDDIQSLPEADAVMILGARVYGSNSMSATLTDRTDTAINVYQNGKANKILVSGDHGQDDYDEVNAVKNYLLEKDINPSDIFLDHAGFNTYDSMYRAKKIFGVRSLIIATQNFHLPRAVCLARNRGIEAYGISADLRPYLTQRENNYREFFARIKAFVYLLINPDPKFLGLEIPIEGDGQLTWD